MKLFEANQWEAAKEALLEGADISHNFDGSVNANKRRIMGVLLENQRKYLMETAAAGVTSATQIAQLNKVILPVLRRVMPTVICNEIVGVQPMQGPIAQIHTMRVSYGESISSGVNAGDEALAPSDIARYYSGDTTNTTTPAGASVGTLEGNPGRKINISTLRQTVEAKTRKLSAVYTFESAQDAMAQQGLDVEQETMAALAQHITAEIDQEILYNLRSLAGTSQTFSQSAVTGTPTFIGDVHAALASQINRAANLIASKTRRGAGNWVVVSPTALTILQTASASAFARTTSGVFDAPTNTKFVGVLNNTLKVYVDGYGQDATPVLVGLKNNETDAAAYYCPYVPLVSSGVVIDPSTMNPTVSFMTRYGYATLSNTSTSLGNSGDYLSKIAIDTTSLTWM